VVAATTVRVLTVDNLLAQKLGIHAESSVLVAHAPKAFTLVRKRGKPPFDVAVVFVNARSEIKKRFSEVRPKMTQAGGVWFAWPKKASKIKTDVTDRALREIVLPTGWVDNKVCAIDERYTGLRFVLRKENRVTRG
jgi:hypothetical protein